jgi:hypothetical protein
MKWASIQGLSDIASNHFDKKSVYKSVIGIELVKAGIGMEGLEIWYNTADKLC